MTRNSSINDPNEANAFSECKLYSFPPFSLLEKGTDADSSAKSRETDERAELLRKALDRLGVQAEIVGATRGPRLTRYEVMTRTGESVRIFSDLADELNLTMGVEGVRVQVPVPVKGVVFVEMPNDTCEVVYLGDLLEKDAFRDSPSVMTVCLGTNVIGDAVFADLGKMPHLLIGGATGMGKSVCINSILVSLLYKARPDEVKLILIDPKKVELSSYNGIPHLLLPVLNDVSHAVNALSWAIEEMERRYDILDQTQKRNIASYNESLDEYPERERLPYIVIVIDELQDLMMQERDTVEMSIARIAAKARAAGIHLIIATQRPTVSVFSGVVKANVPSRIAFHVTSQVASRTILDATGAERLLNGGDMLVCSPIIGTMNAQRMQGAFVSDGEVSRVCEYLKKNFPSVKCDMQILAEVERKREEKTYAETVSEELEEEKAAEEALLERAIHVTLGEEKVSTSLLQRKLFIGFGKAARLIDRMEAMGIVSPPNGMRPREVLLTAKEYRAMRTKK